MSGPPGANPNTGAVPVLCGAHDGPHPAHPSKLFLDQVVTGVDAVVRLGALIVEATRPSFELAADEAQPQPVADAVAQFRIERRESHAAASSHGALPKPLAAFRQQRPVLTCAMVPFYLGYPWGAFFCTLSTGRRASRSTALPWPANPSTPSRR